jgi:hypothetical protein
MIRLFFVLYCFEAGLLLLWAPWMPEWERLMLQLAPWQGLRGLLLHPWFRGAVSGFGSVHLVWGAHDLIAIVTRRYPEPVVDRPDEPQDVPAARDQ